MTEIAPLDEASRIRVLHQFSVLDTPPEQAYNDITEVVAYIAKVPIVLVSLIDEARQWFKAKLGIDVCETPRDMAFCAHAILTPHQPLIVPDATKDERFANNPLVTGEPNIRFYLGVPLVTPEGAALGTLCAIDRVPRELDAEQIKSIKALAHMAMSQLELRRQASCLRQAATYIDQHLHKHEHGHLHDLMQRSHHKHH